ncbi:MAG: SET domain-containing protein-lysine N-methyltransferase [Candidatus Pacebacteria bacterium]|nr:SET domain-containing protein-lysine N-methyltransferase [Candidatus Paceibacterota bacterium]MBP9840284.1 SET domain-containing protein-lysine N-methyltransferase [Candidatus Paceibacterota bacterium]
MDVVEGKSKIKGGGLFAARAFRRGGRIIRMSGKRMSERQIDKLIERGKLRLDDPFEISNGRYIVLDPLPLLANHSCNPNAGVRGIDELVALRAIKKGEEITYDYSTMVGDTAPHETPWTMRCRCGGKTCRTKVGNWRTIPPARLAHYKRQDALPTFVQKLANG